MKTIHLIMTGKGGVGKSFVATLIAQYLSKLGERPFCADTDPTNPTFNSYRAFNATHVRIMTADMNIDKSGFDQLVELLLEAPGHCVVDNGSSSFLPIMAYMLENSVIPFLRENGINVVIHAVIIGGIGLDETVRGLESVLLSHAAPVVVWENEIFGPVQKEGADFSGSKVYLTHRDRILGVVRIKQRGEDTFGKDMKMLTSNRLTFDEAMKSSEFRIMSRQRLQTVRRDIDEQLDRIDFTDA